MAKTATEVFNRQIWANKMLRQMTRDISMGMEMTRRLTPQPLRKFKGFGNDGLVFEYQDFVVEADLTRYYEANPVTKKSDCTGGRISVRVHAVKADDMGVFLCASEIALPEEVSVYSDPNVLLMANLPMIIQKAKERLWDRIADPGGTDRVTVGRAMPTMSSARKP